MSYTAIIFEAKDAWMLDLCSFKVNLVLEELSLEYRNHKGGYTTNGIKLKSHQTKRIKKIASPKILEEFREDKWKEGRDPEIVLDGIFWNVQFISNDGLPILEMKNDVYIQSPPDILVELVNYILEIGKPVDAPSNLF